MALVLSERIQAGTIKSGSETVELASGEWLRVQYGTTQSPTTMIQVQVPVSKKWTVNVFIDLSEQTA